MKLGFIGTGNMAGAIMGGIIKNGVLKPEEIIGSDILEAGREKVCICRPWRFGSAAGGADGRARRGETYGGGHFG